MIGVRSSVISQVGHSVDCERFCTWYVLTIIQTIRTNPDQLLDNKNRSESFNIRISKFCTCKFALILIEKNKRFKNLNVLIVKQERKLV